MAERAKWATREEEESRPWGEAGTKERGKGKLRADMATGPTGPKDRNGEEIPLSFISSVFQMHFQIHLKQFEV